MKVNDLNNVNENTNLHLTHLEDLALFQGKAGALKAVEFLRNLSQVAKSSSPLSLWFARVHRAYAIPA